MQTMSKCKRCGSQLTFVKIGGKYHPKNPDGSDHHDICRQIVNAAVMQRNVKFNDEKGSGFLKTDNKKMYMIMKSESIVGKHYKESVCDCVPWIGCDLCAN